MHSKRHNKKHTWEIYGMHSDPENYYNKAAFDCPHSFELLEIRKFVPRPFEYETLYVFKCAHCRIYHVYSPEISLTFQTLSLKSGLLENKHLIKVIIVD